MLIMQAPFGQRLDNAIHSINCSLVDVVVLFLSSYPMDSGLSVG